MTDLFNRPQSAETRALVSIDSSKYPDTNKDFEANLARLNVFVDYLAASMAQVQKGVDQANMDVFARSKDILSNFVVLLGGGTIADLDFGDLQYFLPALGALFGFDANTPFPLNLFNAAEQFFLGYVVPLDSFGTTIQDILIGLLTTLGINEEFIDAFSELLTELNELGTDLLEIFNNLFDLLDIFGINTDGFGPFGDLWHVITQLLGGFGIDTLGAITDPIFEALAPWVRTLAEFVDALDQVVKGFTGGIFDTTGILNLATLFNPLNLLDGSFNPLSAWTTMITNFFSPTGLLLGPDSPLNAFNIFGLLNPFNLPLLPLSHLTNQAGPNLLVAPGFDDDQGLGQGWIWDSSQGRTTNGSARASAGSVKRELRSNFIPVAEGQVLNISVWMKWASLAYSGTPITVSVARYSGVTLIGSANIVSPSSPATNNATWTQYTGNYTVPSGCDNVTLNFVVSATATFGNVWFDDASVTKSGNTLPQSWIFDLVPQLAGLVDFFEQIVDAIVTVITGIPFFGAVLGPAAESLFDSLFGWFDDTQVTAANASDALIGVQATQDIIVSQTTGTVMTGTSDTDVEDALNNQSSTIAQQGAQIAALQQTITQSSTSGNSVLEQFEYTDTDSLDPGLWARKFLAGSSANAVIAVADGHNAGMEVVSGTPTVTEFDWYIGPVPKTQTRYQKVGITIANKMSSPGAFDGRKSWDWVYVRVSVDGEYWVRGGVSCVGEAKIEYKNGSGDTIHTLASDTGSVNTDRIPNIGDTLYMVAGAAGVLRQFQILIGDRVIFSANDSGLATSVDADENTAVYKSFGWGQTVDGGLMPGKVTQFSAVDFAPVPVPGVGFRMFKSSGSVNLATTGKVPNNFFDAIAYQSADVTITSGTNSQFTVGKRGTYILKYRLQNTTVFSFNGAGAAITLYKGASVVERDWALTLGSADADVTPQPAGFFMFIAEAGDTFALGYAVTGGTSMSVDGDSGGIGTYFELQKVA